MSRPRVPFGNDRPGHLAATSIRVLAAEMSDAGRFARGKRYWSDQAVTDVVVGHGVVTAEVLGSRREPYVVTIETRPGHKVPPRADVTVRCTCPDDDGWGRSACKHAVAALLALGDEITVEPALLERWRRTDAIADPENFDGDDPLLDHTHVDSTGREPSADRSTDGSAEHPLAAMLRSPEGATLPPVPELADAAHPRFPDPLVADVIDDALDALRLRWE